MCIRDRYDDNTVEALKAEPASESKPVQQNETVDEVISTHSKLMLVIEDNADVRQFIRTHFIENFKIIEATNGEEGWQKALETIPDIIISDILMPKVDGYEFCRKLKNDERTSHIPIILLTAMHSKEHEIKGLSTGADDYITKPFDLSVLQAKVENILSIRDSLKQKYTDTVVLEPTNVVLSSPEERFLKKAINVIEENIADSELDIEKFAQLVGVSRMQLYRKLHALTNMTVKEFIRHIRLKRAAQLLVQEKLNISEIAYEVGFKDLSHFRKCFKREFGMSSTEYIAQKREN
jgi:DNA-binding response OmpR family regulator